MSENSFHVSEAELDFPEALNPNDKPLNANEKDLKSGENPQSEPTIVQPEIKVETISKAKAPLSQDEKRKLWLDKSAIYVLTSFCNRKSIDVDKSKVLRSNSSMILPKKTIEVNNLSVPFRNPFVLAGIKELTEVQKLVRSLFVSLKTSAERASKTTGDGTKTPTESGKHEDETKQSSSTTTETLDAKGKPIIKRSAEEAETLEGEFPRRGSVAINASCGSGKTFAGIYCIYKFQCKTLIISTRNAVIDQWVASIEKMYPGVKIWTSERKGKRSKIPLQDYDIWITTPQYLNAKAKIVDINFNIKPSLIIYDEIHTMLSESSKGNDHRKEFLNVLKYPFIRCLNRDWTELPYMLGLSATYPKDNKLIERIFGIPKHINCSITKIGIDVWDTRDFIGNRGPCDMKYEPYSQQEALVYFVMRIPFYRDGTKIEVRPKLVSHKIKPMKFDPIEITPKFKGLVVTKNINESVWSALFVHKILHTNVLLIRTNDVASYYFSKDFPVTDRVSQDVTYDDLSKNNWGTPCKYTEHIDEAEIIVSTTSRLKEGFSVRNLTWGICCQFMYSVASRVQLLGRIRRSSEDVELNSRRRIFYVNSGIVPSDMYVGSRKNLHPTATYDWKFEEELFARENIHYISPHIFGEPPQPKKDKK